MDEVTDTVTIYNAKRSTRLMVIKLESAHATTMTKAIKAGSDYDVDNYWMAIKPADNVVFDMALYGRKRLVVNEILFTLEKR